MSDYHIQKTDVMLKTVSCVFHIPIPATNNTIGVSWQDALVLSLGGADAITSTLTDITPAEESAMKAGSIYENTATIRFSSLNLTNAERLAEVEAAYTAAKTDVLAEKQVTLNFYGKSGDVA
jgi:hypothetical protein